jgi:membrane protein DedA with SNARE-associated domain
VGTVVDTLMHVQPGWVYGLAALLVFAEAALFFGFVVPGETAVVVGGVLAAQGRVELAWLMVIVVVAAVAGDSVGYEIGRRAGGRLIASKALRRHRAGVEKAQDLIRRRGAMAVFLGRFLALLRALMPALAGSSKLPYPRFLVFNAAGGLFWGVGFTLVGYLAGAAYKRVENLIGTGSAIAFAVLVVAGVIVWALRRRRRENAEERRAREEQPEPTGESR